MIHDFLVIGGGISGLSAGYELALHGSVAVVEAEDAPGYHSTGRSAALFTPNYGGPQVRRISAASLDFLEHPPAAFCTRPLLGPRGALTVAAPGEEAALDPILALSRPGAELHRLTGAEVCVLAPVLRRERVGAGAFEPGVTDIDVAELQQAYARGLKARGGHLLVGHRIDALAHGAHGWEVRAGAGRVAGRVAVNAAGAWAGAVGALAGAADLGLLPRRRTAIVVDAQPGLVPQAMPLVDFTATPAYLKPEGGRLMASLGDATPVAPQDVRPDEMDVAILVDWLERESYVGVRRIAHSWAGLRTFTADEAPVAGFDPQVPDFFWLAGQGGYGIMMAPALARATAALVVSGTLPPDLAAAGLTPGDLAPARLAAPPPG